MMRGFQIWPQNSNLMTFDPLLAKKYVGPKSGGQMLGQNGGQMSYYTSYYMRNKLQTVLPGSQGVSNIYLLRMGSIGMELKYVERLL